MGFDTVSGIGNGTIGAGPSTKTPTGSSALGKDQFVKLMMAQLSNQDPTAPMDSQAFVAQLAQFSSVEQLQNANSSLNSLLLAQAAANSTSAVALVGKDALFKSDTITLGTSNGTFKNSASTATTCVANLKSKAEQVTVTITDSSGKVVRTMQLGAHEAGSMDIKWDGKDNDGNACAAGDYKIKVTAADAKGNDVPVDQRARGRITGVSYSNGFAELMIGDRRIKMGDVVEVKES